MMLTHKQVMGLLHNNYKRPVSVLKLMTPWMDSIVHSHELLHAQHNFLYMELGGGGIPLDMEFMTPW